MGATVRSQTKTRISKTTHNQNHNNKKISNHKNIKHNNNTKRNNRNNTNNDDIPEDYKFQLAMRRTTQ